MLPGKKVKTETFKEFLVLAQKIKAQQIRVSAHMEQMESLSTRSLGNLYDLGVLYRAQGTLARSVSFFEIGMHRTLSGREHTDAYRLDIDKLICVITADQRVQKHRGHADFQFLLWTSNEPATDRDRAELLAAAKARNLRPF